MSKLFCEHCGRKLVPCPARRDGAETTVGFYVCVCTEDAWRESPGVDHGQSYEEYLAELRVSQPAPLERLAAALAVLGKIHKHNQQENRVYLEQDGRPLDFSICLGEAYQESDLCEQVGWALAAGAETTNSKRQTPGNKIAIAAAEIFGFLVVNGARKKEAELKAYLLDVLNGLVSGDRLSPPQV